MRDRAKRTSEKRLTGGQNRLGDLAVGGLRIAYSASWDVTDLKNGKSILKIFSGRMAKYIGTIEKAIILHSENIKKPMENQRFALIIEIAHS